MSADGQRTKWCRYITESFNRLSRAHERYRQTDGRPMTYSEREREYVSSRSLKTIHFLADPLVTINFLPIPCFVATFNSIVIYTGVVFIRHNKKP